jgi:GATA zinc finger
MFPKRCERRVSLATLLCALALRVVNCSTGMPMVQQKLRADELSPASLPRNASNLKVWFASLLARSFVDSADPPAIRAHHDVEAVLRSPSVAHPWVCILCGTSKTPMKRNHPVHGPKTLCNACGVRLSRRVKADKGKGSTERAGGNGLKARAALRQVKLPQPDEPPRTRTERKRTERALQALDMDSSDDAQDAVHKRARLCGKGRTARYRPGCDFLPG